jgi:FkbM family methyltransferase
MKHALRAMTDPVNAKSLFLTVLCLKAWAGAKFGRWTASKEVMLDLKHLRLCVDISRADLVGYWEVWHDRCYDAIDLDRPQCVVDVGANIGAFSLYQAMVKNAEQVIAFEPSPQTFTRLAKNIEINGLRNVRLVNAAVGDKRGVLSFSEDPMPVLCRVSESGRLKVPGVTLDDELRDVPSIDILKIDTEGYETHVLRGASETLKKTKRIAFELHYPAEQQEIESILFPLGFSLAKMHAGLAFYCAATPLNPEQTLLRPDSVSALDSA